MVGQRIGDVEIKVKMKIGDEKDLVGVVDMIEMKEMKWDGKIGDKEKVGEIKEDMEEKDEEYSEKIIEIDVEIDEEEMEEYIEGKMNKNEEMRDMIRKGKIEVKLNKII